MKQFTPDERFGPNVSVRRIVFMKFIFIFVFILIIFIYYLFIQEDVLERLDATQEEIAQPYWQGIENNLFDGIQFLDVDDPDSATKA